MNLYLMLIIIGACLICTATGIVIGLKIQRRAYEKQLVIKLLEMKDKYEHYKRY